MKKLKTKKEKNKNELKPYHIDKLSKIPTYLKVGFLKFWVFAAAYFLTFVPFFSSFDGLDMIVMLTLILWLAAEFLINSVIIWMDHDGRDTIKYLPHRLKRKTIRSFLLTGVYVLFIVAASYFFIEAFMSFGIPSIGQLLSGSNRNDPITFGLVCLLFDFVWRKVAMLFYLGKEKSV